MKKGILVTVLFYIIGFCVTYITSLTSKPASAHAPSLHHFILFTTCVIGIIWTMISLILYSRKRSLFLKGVIATNAIVLVSVFIVLFIFKR